MLARVMSRKRLQKAKRLKWEGGLLQVQHDEYFSSNSMVGLV